MIEKRNLGIKASGESKVGPLLWERGREWRITQLSAIFSTYGDEGIKTSNPKFMPSLAYVAPTDEMDNTYLAAG